MSDQHASSSISRRAFLGLAGAAAGALALSACASGSQDSGSPSADSSASGSSAASSSASSGTLTQPLDNGYGSGTHHATMEVQGFGTIKLELLADVAPITVSNFCDLASQGFYDGLTFHRIIKGFMIQGGDPNGDGTGGSGRTIKGEFSDNGVKNVLQHKRGVISMARSSQNDSASSQFFIMQEDTDSLDGSYAAFGKVTDGLDVVDAIAEVPVQDSNGTVAKEDQPIITSLTIDD